MGDYYLINSSNKVIAIPIADWKRHGPNVAANRDDLGENFAGWRKATEESHAIEYVKRQAFEVFVAERHEHMADPVLKKYATDIGYAGPLGDLGKYLSKAETLRQDWNRYLASKEGQELARAMSGDESRVQYIGVIPQEAMYSVRKLPDGKVLLAVGDQHYNALLRLSKIAGSPITGISLEDIILRGLGEEADRDWVDKNLNLAAKLVDGQKIYIREKSNGQAGAMTADKINLNSASLSELDSLWGVGEVRAGEIVKNRPYAKVEELLTKKIVTKSVFEKIKDQITVY